MLRCLICSKSELPKNKLKWVMGNNMGNDNFLFCWNMDGGGAAESEY